MQLQELLDASPLRVSVLYAEGDDLRREFTWTYTTDLIDPRRYLSRGQLLLSGLVWHQGPESSDTFVGRAAEAGAAALLVGDARHGYVPDDVIAACRRHRLPLLLVPRDVSFAAVIAFVSNAQAATRVQQLAAGLVRQRELLLDVYRGQMLSELVARIAGDLGRPLWILSATGRAVAASNAPPPERIVDDVLAAYFTGAPSPLIVGGHEPVTAFIITAPGDHAAAGWLLTLEGDWRQWHPSIVDVVRELASVVGLYRVQHRAHVFDQAHATTRLLELADSDIEHPELRAYLHQAGIAPDARVIVAAAAFEGAADHVELALEILADAVGHVCAPVVGRDDAGHAIALVSVAPETTGLATEVTSALRRIGAGLDAEVPLRVGSSMPATTDRLGGALRAARASLRRPADGGTVRIVDGSKALKGTDLLSAVPDGLRREFAERLLGPIIEHDARHHGSLMDTLRAFLECDGSWVRTAEALHLHQNSARYRIARIEQVTDLDLGTTAARADLFLALHAL